jgi:hypothetical protein
LDLFQDIIKSLAVSMRKKPLGKAPKGKKKTPKISITGAMDISYSPYRQQPVK